MSTAFNVPSPPAFASFCSISPRDCVRVGGTSPVALTPQRWRELEATNTVVNRALRKINDAEHHGREEVWSIPIDGAGDCEDFALLKRRRLIDRGWPSSALLVTMAKTWSGEGHAVLTVVTNQGDYILDSESSAIRPWNATGYQFVARQSHINPRVWAVIGPPGSRKPASIATGRLTRKIRRLG